MNSTVAVHDNHLRSTAKYDAPKEFEHVFEVMSQPSFLHMSGLGGEQPFYICDYPASSEPEVRECINALVSRLQTTKYSDGSPAPRILRIDLFDSVCEFLRHRGVLNRVIDLEQRLHTQIAADPMQDRFLDLLIGMVNATTNNLYDFLAECYEQAFEDGEADIVFLTGIGAVYPYVRGHTLLNNLQGRIERSPSSCSSPAPMRKVPRQVRRCDYMTRLKRTTTTGRKTSGRYPSFIDGIPIRSTTN